MGLLKGPLKKRESTMKVVYSEDPEVKTPPQRQGSGWFPLEEALGTSRDATIVTIQGLNADTRTMVRDLSGDHQRYLASARAGVIACNEVEREGGKHASEGLGLWLDCLAIDDPRALVLLGLRVLNLTDGMSPEAYYEVARRSFGVLQGGGEGPDDGSTKSARASA